MSVESICGGTGSTFFILGVFLVPQLYICFARIPETSNMNKHALKPKKMSNLTL